MQFSRIHTRVMAVLVLVLIISGCSMLPSTSSGSSDISAEETADLIRTDSASTVVAQITQDAVDHPSATPLPSETPARPTAVEAAAAQASTTTTVEPTATEVFVSGPVTKPAYACKLIKQNPHDGYPVEAAGFFDVTWTVQNTGTATWSEDFIYRYWKGDQIAKTAHFLLPRETLPDKTVDLTVDMIAPYDIGKYTSWWELVDASGNRVCKFYASIVVDAPTEEPTLTPYY